MVSCVVKFHTGDTCDAFEIFFQAFPSFIGNVRYHDPGCSIGDKFIVHYGKALPGFRFFRKISSNIVFYLDPISRKETEYQGKNVQKEKQIPFIHNKSSQFFHRRCFAFFHTRPVLPYPFVLVYNSGIFNRQL